MPAHHRDHGLLSNRRQFLAAGGAGVLALGGLGFAAAPHVAHAFQLDSTPPAPPVPVAPSTDPIADLAATLTYDVDAIVAFVRDRIHYEAYAGVLRGARGTLLARAGNATDQAVLLGALLDAARVNWRYATGALDAAATETASPRTSPSPAPRPAAPTTRPPRRPSSRPPAWTRCRPHRPAPTPKSPSCSTASRRMRPWRWTGRRKPPPPPARPSPTPSPGPGSTSRPSRTRPCRRPKSSAMPGSRSPMVRPGSITTRPCRKGRSRSRRSRRSPRFRTTGITSCGWSFRPTSSRAGRCIAARWCRSPPPASGWSMFRSR